MVSVDPLTLRSYQTQILQNIFSAFARGQRRVFLQLPTGGGKTHCFSHLATEFLNQKQGVLVVAHRKELIDQAHDKLTAISGLPAAKITAGKKVDPTYQLHIASIQTIRNRKNKPNAGLVIIDEAHHGTAKSYADLIEAYPEAYILGVSATPHRGDGQALRDYFDQLVTGPSVEQLTEEGFLAPYRLFASIYQVDTKGVKTQNGDYNKKQLKSAVNQSVVAGDVVETYLKHANGKQTVVFNVSVEYSQKLTASFLEAGIPAAHIDGSTPKQERDRLIQQFRDREIRVLCNCEIVTEGFDVPGMEAVQIVRPTKSLILWLQMVGRVLRPFQGKEYAIIIDHTDNWNRLGLPDDPREWSLEPQSLPPDQSTVRCESCTHVFRPKDHETKQAHSWLPAGNFLKPQYMATCPNCHELVSLNLEGESVPREGQGKQVQFVEAELSEVPRGVQGWLYEIFNRLQTIRAERGYKRGWVVYRLEEFRLFDYISLKSWYYLAAQLGYRRRWADHKWQLAVGLRETEDDPLEPPHRLSEDIKQCEPNPPEELLESARTELQKYERSQRPQSSKTSLFDALREEDAA